jgi:hypothetical protein
MAEPYIAQEFIYQLLCDWLSLTALQAMDESAAPWRWERIIALLMKLRPGAKFLILGRVFLTH